MAQLSLCILLRQTGCHTDQIHPSGTEVLTASNEVAPTLIVHMNIHVYLPDSVFNSVYHAHMPTSPACKS